MSEEAERSDFVTTHDLLDDLSRRDEVNVSLVNLHLISVPRLRSFTARLDGTMSMKEKQINEIDYLQFSVW